MKAKNITSTYLLGITGTLCLSTILIVGSISCEDTSPTEMVAIPAKMTQYCATCHGADMEGGMSQSLLDGNWQFGGERRSIFRWVKFGLPHVGMPSWQSVLSDDEI